MPPFSSKELNILAQATDILYRRGVGKEAQAQLQDIISEVISADDSEVTTVEETKAEDKEDLSFLNTI